MTQPLVSCGDRVDTATHRIEDMIEMTPDATVIFVAIICIGEPLSEDKKTVSMEQGGNESKAAVYVHVPWEGPLSEHVGSDRPQTPRLSSSRSGALRTARPAARCP